MKSNDFKLDEIDYLPTESIANFAKFYSKSFPELRLTDSALIEFLCHKFQIANKSNLLNMAALITTDGNVASGYGIVRNEYSIGGERIDVGLVCDVFTSPEFRKMGMFKKVSLLAITREELTTTNFLIGFPIRDEVMPGHLSVGWRHIFDMPLWWGLPRVGSKRNIERNCELHASMFDSQERAIALNMTNEFLKWRFSLFSVDYHLVTVPESRDFAIVRKSKLKGIPFTCIIYMQSTTLKSTKKLVRKIRNLSLRLATVGVIGSWNDTYADELFLANSGLRKSSRFQKVIVRQMRDFKCSSNESDFRLSWMDSDTL
jgi:hypothetical protein